MSERERLNDGAPRKVDELDSAILELQYALDEPVQQEHNSARVNNAQRKLAGACIANEHVVDLLLSEIHDLREQHRQMEEALQEVVMDLNGRQLPVPEKTRLQCERALGKHFDIRTFEWVDLEASESSNRLED